VVSTEGRIEYGRDARGRLVRLRTSTGIDTEYRYDALGRIEKVIDRGLATESGEIAFNYDALGRKKEVARPGGTKSVYGYDPHAGWTASIAHLDADDENLLTLEYGRDFTGIVDSIRERQVDDNDADTDEELLSWWYRYDGLKRLVDAERRDGLAETDALLESFAYDYDRNGNRASETRPSLSGPHGLPLAAPLQVCRSGDRRSRSPPPACPQMHRTDSVLALEDGGA